MNGKQSLQKTLRKQQRANHRTAFKKISYMEVGNWRFQENDAGDLVVINLETQQNVILFRKEGGINDA